MRLVAAALILLLVGCSEPAETEQLPPEPAPVTVEPRPPANSSAVKAAIAALREEPKIIDVVYDPQLVVPWTIGMTNDGTPRVGYAEYICSVLKEHDAADASTSVRIVDYRAYMGNGGDARGTSMGHVDCATGQDLGV